MLIASTLAQATPSQPGPMRIVIMVGITIGVLLICTLVILAVRRRLLASPTSVAAGGFLEELRLLRDQGKLSPEEFNAAKARMAAAIRGGAGLSAGQSVIATNNSQRASTNTSMQRRSSARSTATPRGRAPQPPPQPPTFGA